MCSWLSFREWCDVRLRCSGGSLPAHRAVLASASKFLRQILLSCPLEDSPTSIVLPDFDLEAMSSVLYYIYNGEVVIEKQKLEMFMEIVNAMQIFVDEKYLPSVCKGVGDAGVSPNEISKKSEVFFLGTNESGPYINLRKGGDIGVLLAKHLHDDLGTQDKHVKCDELSKQPHFGSVQSSSEDRQRSCFLRDLFIETYPRNGNANGRAAGVLAIPNEHYRAASVVLTNANGKHLAADDTLSAMENKTTALHQWPQNSNVFGQQIFQNCNPRTDNINATNYAELAQIQSLENPWPYPKLLSRSCDISRNSYVDRCQLQRSQILSTGLQELTKTSLNFNNMEKYLDFLSVYGPTTSNLEKRKENTDHLNTTNCRMNTSTTVLTKGAILNQVLESPWCPRQPNNYKPKPFRRKVKTFLDTVSENQKEDCINDSNNNIRTSPHQEVTETIPSDVAAPPLFPTDDSVVAADFKCTICNQIFPDSSTLSAHARRHAAPGRYSCAECSKSFSQLRNFKYHMSIHRGTREFAATCTVCGKYFNDRGYLSSHMKIHRNRKEYKCPQCPKSFNQRVAYNMHVRIHTGIKPHVCGECGKAFSRKMLLKQHQRTHSGERPYACPHCDKRFADRSNMTLHLRLHTGVKPFSCTLCPKSFTKKHHLKSHLNFHTGAKPYSCPRCKLAFTQSSNMRTHLKKCTAPDPLSRADKPGSA